jgi:hypothetical protein
LRRARRRRRHGRTGSWIAVLVWEGKAVFGHPIDVTGCRSACPRWPPRPVRRRVALPDKTRKLRKRIAATIGPRIAISHRTCSDSGALLQF